MSEPVHRFCLTQEAIDAWAQLSSDYNPLHVSPEFAERSSFGGTIAHGHMTVSYVLRLMMAINGEAWLSGGVVGEVKFKSPVRPGTTYTVTALPTKNGARDSWTVEIRDETAGTLALTANAYLVPRRASCL